MRFIKLQGIIANQDFLEANENRSESRRISHFLSMKAEEFNQKHNDKGYYFVSNIDDDLIVLGALVDGLNDAQIEKRFLQFIKAIKLSVTDITLEEVTLSNMSNLLGYATRCGFIDDDDEILEAFNLEGLSGRFGRDMDYGENLLAEVSKEELYKQAEKYLSKETLIPELDKIYETGVESGKYGHPVHYFVETDDRELRKDFYRIILQALRQNGRLQNRRYSFVDINPGSRFPKQLYDNLYNSCSGGAVVVRIRTAGTTEDNHASAERENIETVCEIMRKYRNKVLTVFCFPRECAKVKEIFREELGNMCFIEIKEDFAKNDAAKNFLKMLAKDNHVRADKKLFSKIEPNQGYLSVELHDIFDEWYDKKLRNDIFPQYKESESIKKIYQESKPKGSAYDELSEMIGLGEAKEVLKQALDYYKAQKLFKDKGMKEDPVAMHMAFTGNAGSAKTSCARLFAQIMKENGLLSTGNCVELTADMLKARYVGWTSPQVKKAFEDAKGGVLFLDEIYSLNGDDGFSMEAISSIVAEMENHREEVVCIFAGYPKETEEFLRKNPGLRSRIAFHVPFADYSVEELCDITKLIAKKNGRKLTDEAIEKLKDIFKGAISEPDFGNGRYCRNLFEKAKMAQSSRLVSMDYDSVTKEDILTIKAEDIMAPMAGSKESKKQKIGFCA